jgi:hypothetical protein
MAGTISGNTEPKYAGSFRAEVFDEQGRAAIAARKAHHDAIDLEAFKETIAKREDNFYAAFKTLAHPCRPEHFPRRVQFTKGKRVYDYNGFIDGGATVSQRFKDAVEAIEPGVHQFFPVELLHKDGTPYGEPLYYWNITSAIDAIRPDLGGVHKMGDPNRPGTHAWVITDGVDRHARKQLAVEAATIAGRAAWKDVRHVAAVFISDALIAALRDAGTEGWMLTTEWAEI